MISGLLRLGADVTYSDPLVPTLRVAGQDVPRADAGAADKSDLVLVFNAHRETDIVELVRSSTLLLDTRRAAPDGYPSVHRL